MLEECLISKGVCLKEVASTKKHLPETCLTSKVFVAQKCVSERCLNTLKQSLSRYLVGGIKKRTDAMKHMYLPLRVVQ